MQNDNKSKNITELINEMAVYGFCDAIGEAISIHDKDFRIIYQNKTSREIFGSHVGEYCYKTYYGADSPDDDCPQIAAHKDGLSHLAEKRAPTKKGLLDFEILSSPLKDPEGNIIAGVEIWRDITQRKDTGKSLNNERNFYSTAINSLPGIFYLIDESGQFTRWNRNFEQVSGYSHDEISGMHFLDFFDDEGKKLVEQRIGEVFAEGESSAEADFISKNGDKTPYFFTVHRMMIEDKNYLVGMGIDIKDRRSSEIAIKEERDRARKYFDIAGVMLLVITADQKVSMINQQGCVILGGKEEDIVGKNWFDNFIPENIREKVRAMFNKLMTGGMKAVSYYENPVVPFGGFQRMIAWHNTVLKDDSGKITGTLSSGEDITDRKRMEKEIRSRMDELESFYSIAVGRELKMKELKREIKRLKDVLSKKQ